MLTVRELIEELECLPQDADVYFVCDYGDIGHTQQALQVVSVEERCEGELIDSAYSQSGWKLVDGQCLNEDGSKVSDWEETSPIVVLEMERE